MQTLLEERGLEGKADVLPKMMPITSSDICYENEMCAELHDHTLRSGKLCNFETIMLFFFPSAAKQSRL